MVLSVPDRKTQLELASQHPSPEEELASMASRERARRRSARWESIRGQQRGLTIERPMLEALE